MFSAVHSDRSGRLVVATDYAAALADGSSIGPLADGLPLPPGTDVVHLPGRTGIGLDRAGRVRELGQGRFGVGAILPIGYLRTGLPAYADNPAAPPLKPRAYAAVGADRNGELVVAAVALDAEAGAADARSAPDLLARITATQRDQPSSRVLRQLARCAKDYRCRAAANAFLGRHDCALPVAAPRNERPPEVLVLHDDADASPTEPAAFRPTPLELADAASRHLDGGGTAVAFGRACEGEPLLVGRLVETAIVEIRKRTRLGTIHLETNGSSPIALRRLCDAGLDSVAIRLASARVETYEAIHRPEGFRFADVRTSIANAIAAKVSVALRVLALPGLTDRAREVDALVGLAGELPAGSSLVLCDLAADPHRALRVAPSAESAIGMGPMIDRLRSDAAHLRIVALPRPLVRL
ncbi:MAG: radical SAM protein [Chloroflexota bacterium]|nr:radical SAM protein [Chloroflexota bacterium]